MGKGSFWFGKRSALHMLAQHAASAGAARCVSHRTALRFSPHPSPSFPKAPSPSPSSASLLPCPRAGHHRGGAVKRKPPLAPSLCGKFKRGLCFILSLYIHPLPFPKGKERAGAGIQLEGACMRNVRLSGENSTPGHAKKRAMVPSAANWRGDPMLSPWQSISQSLSPS